MVSRKLQMSLNLFGNVVTCCIHFIVILCITHKTVRLLWQQRKHRRCYFAIYNDNNNNNDDSWRIAGGRRSMYVFWVERERGLCELGYGRKIDSMRHERTRAREKVRRTRSLIVSLNKHWNEIELNYYQQKIIRCDDKYQVIFCHTLMAYIFMHVFTRATIKSIPHLINSVRFTLSSLQ